mmetsp:Transcript_69388/g.166372  ORF Transcript_69388/g.166372 Transcript_69388/m.166372 type:complete len:404 (+) Transcript_69388:137-1348(+)
MLFLFGTDTDRLFSYHTRELVEVKDRWLGITNNMLTLLIICYILFYVFLYDEGYLELEPAQGATVIQVSGDAAALSSGVSGVRYFSAEEITYPGMENGNVFVATRAHITKQTRGTCEDFEMPCSSDTECSVVANGTCSSGGFCYEPSWCSDAAKPETYEIESSILEVMVKSSIQFLKLDSQQVFSTEYEHPYPELGFNTYTVRDLLMMVEPVPVRYEEISELGAIVRVQFMWECVVRTGGYTDWIYSLLAGSLRDEKCEPRASARRLDTLFDPDHIGYGFSIAERISENERYLNKFSGVQFVMQTIGKGTKFSWVESIMKASLNSSILSLAAILTDLLMLSVFRNKRQFQARKYEISPDFSEHMDKIEQHQKRVVERKKRLDEEDAQARGKEEGWKEQIEEDL